jgi:GLPGLI family protein
MKILYLFLLVSFSLYSQNNTGYAIYKKQITVDNNQIDTLDNVPSYVKSSLKSMKPIVENYEFILEFEDNKSLFYQKDIMSSDSDNFTNKLAQSIYGLNSSFINLLDTDISYENTTAFNKNVLIKRESFNNWKLVNKSKLINGKKCYMAKRLKKIDTKRGVQDIEVIAWYDPSINLSLGPYENYGLPGLIVQLEENNVITFLDKLVFKQNIKVIELPEKREIMTEDEFNSFFKQNATQVRGH